MLLLGLFLVTGDAAADDKKKDSGKLPIRILSGDSAPVQRRGVFVLQGNVKVQKDDALLAAHRMTYDRTSELLTAQGQVQLHNSSFDLSCDHLVFRLRENRGVAWGRPKVIQTVKDKDAATKGKSWIDLRAAQIKFFSTEKRISALEDVVLVQFETKKGVTAAAFRIRCRAMEALMESHRSVFKGGVKVETPEVGAQGERVYFHQLERKFYVIGAASAWNYDEKGKAINVIRGNKIVHFFDEKRSVVLGSVTAHVFPETETRSHPLIVEDDEGGSK